jgi:hypothetical protein
MQLGALDNRYDHTSTTITPRTAVEVRSSYGACRKSAANHLGKQLADVSEARRIIGFSRDYEAGGDPALAETTKHKARLQEPGRSRKFKTRSSSRPFGSRHMDRRVQPNSWPNVGMRVVAGAASRRVVAP